MRRADVDLTITQVVLCRLYTDVTLRKRFLADPQAVGKELGLDPQQISELAKIPPRQLNCFATSLIRKRRGEVRKLLPLTKQALGKRFDSLFRRFAEDHRLAMPQPHKKDAIAFCRFLKDSVRSKPSQEPWVLDVAAFEAACLEATARDRRWTIRLFRYSIQELAQQLSQERREFLPLARFTLAVWLRPSRQSRLRFFTLPLPRPSW